MVYCGKPSKGCSVCRERKVRCDQEEPSCGQCQRRGNDCPGYRNLVDLMFRDESKHVIKKAINTRGRGSRPVSKSEHGADVAAPDELYLLPLSRLARSSARSSPSGTQDSRHPQQRAGPSPPPSSPRSAAGFRASREPEVRSKGQTGRQQSSQRDHVLSNSPRLGVLTPQSERIASVNSDDSPSDEETSAIAHGPLIFSYYDPELDTCLPRIRSHGTEGEETDTTGEGEESRKLMGSLTYSLTPSLCERGTAFFFSRYVAVEASCHQGFDFIYEVWKPPAQSGAYFASSVDGVTASIVAVGLAGLSKLTGNREALTQAQHSYGIALVHTNAALRDATKRAADSTMLAVLILGTYEFLAGRSPQTMSAWQDHVTGAATLASMRGTAQFATNAGTRMFLMLCHSVLINCIQSGLPMPASMVELRTELVRQQESERSSWRLADPVYRALQIRYDIKSGLITDLDTIVRKLTDIDDEFACLLGGLPNSWAYRTVELTQDNPAVFGRRCHIYPGLQQVTLWNGLRTVRMLVQETILEQLYTYAATSPSWVLPAQYQQLLVRTMDMLEKLGDAIVESVPQHFGVVSTKSVLPGGPGQGALPLREKGNTIRDVLSITKSRSATPAHLPAQGTSAVTGPTLLDPIKSEGSDEMAERFMTLASVSNTLLWPLYVLGMSSSCTREKREYVMDRIDAIYRETKLEQARSVARLLDDRVESVAWESISLSNMPGIPAEVLIAAM